MKSIPETLQQHDIGIAITGPLLQIQELALVVSLQGRHRVSTNYYSLANLLIVTVYEPSLYPAHINEPWIVQRRMSAALPSQSCAVTHRVSAAASLKDIVRDLETLLEEGYPS